MRVDAHLDIAYNALLNGHSFATEPPDGYAVSRSTLAAAGVGLVCATLMCAPKQARPQIVALSGREPPLELFYESVREASIIANAQIGYYASVGLRMLRTATELREYRSSWEPGQLAAILLLEGADAIERPDDAAWWFDRGLRIVGPAWTKTQYAGGTGAPGGMTTLGIQLLHEMAKLGYVLDISHLADQAIADALETWNGPIMSSHANARHLVPGDRQLADWAIRAIADRGGVLGISFHDGHLTAGHPADPSVVAEHAAYLATVAGDPVHVGIGSDLDGGFPTSRAAITNMDQLDTIEDELLKHFDPDEVSGILGRNWLDFFETALPE
jgi:membrane dipeptidase